MVFEDTLRKVYIEDDVSRGNTREIYGLAYPVPRKFHVGYPVTALTRSSAVKFSPRVSKRPESGKSYELRQERTSSELLSRLISNGHRSGRD